MGFLSRRKKTKAAHKKSKTGGKAFCTTCKVWYNLNSRRQFKKHDHTK